MKAYGVFFRNQFQNGLLKRATGEIFWSRGSSRFLTRRTCVCSCNSNPRSPAPIKLAIAGGDGYMNMVLRPYVEQFSTKSHDWQNYIKFLFIPLGELFDSRFDRLVQLCQSAICKENGELFGSFQVLARLENFSVLWIQRTTTCFKTRRGKTCLRKMTTRDQATEVMRRAGFCFVRKCSVFCCPFCLTEVGGENAALTADMSEVVSRVTRYLNNASQVLQLPIAEAMITYKEKRYSRYAPHLHLPLSCFLSFDQGNARLHL